MLIPGVVGFDYAKTVLLVCLAGAVGMGALGVGLRRSIAGDDAAGRAVPHTMVLSQQAGVGDIVRAVDVGRSLTRMVNRAAAEGAHVLTPAERFTGHFVSLLRGSEGPDESIRFATARTLMEPTIDRAFVHREAGLAPMKDGDLERHVAVRHWRGSWLPSDLLFQATGMHLPPDQAADTWERVLARLRHPVLLRTKTLEEAVPRASNPPMGVVNPERALRDARAVAFDNRSGFYRQDAIKILTNLAIQTARELHVQAAIMFIDFDNFKMVNNTFGHQIGEAVIKKVTSTMAKAVRDEDLVARFGGDEFVVLSPDVTAEEALAIGRRLQEAVAASMDASWLKGILSANGLIHLISKVDSQWRQTISVGVAHAKRPRDAEELMRQADISQYGAKDRGRNTVHLMEAQ